MSDFVQQNSTVCSFNTNSSWVVLSSIEMSIKRKVESIGTPLKNWDIQIYRGILTGLNEAFIISSDKRDEILNNCATDEERIRTDEVIRPILRGKDICQYSYNWKNLYLCWIPWHFPYHLDSSIQGASVKAEKAFQKEYSALYNHLLNYKDLLSKRNEAETGIRYEWYALQRWGANYWDVLTQPKIIFQEIVQSSQFAFDLNGKFCCNDTCRMITGKNLLHLLGLLNSNLFFFAIKKFYGGGGLGESGVRMKHTFFNDFHCIPVSNEIEDLVAKIISNKDANTNSACVSKINEIVYEKYGLNAEEIKYIEENR